MTHWCAFHYFYYVLHHVKKLKFKFNFPALQWTCLALGTAGMNLTIKICNLLATICIPLLTCVQRQPAARILNGYDSLQCYRVPRAPVLSLRSQTKGGGFGTEGSSTQGQIVLAPWGCACRVRGTHQTCGCHGQPLHCVSPRPLCLPDTS